MIASILGIISVLFLLGIIVWLMITNIQDKEITGHV